MPDDGAIVNLDFTNAFNCLRRDAMLKAVATDLPELYKFCHICYSHPTALRFGEHLIRSEEGAQQGDPLGPLLFCLTIQPLLLSLSSDLVMAFMDDVTLGGSQKTLAADVRRITAKGPEIGLTLNSTKCEVITSSGICTMAGLSAVQQRMPVTSLLLGAPLTTGSAMDECLTTRCDELSRAVSRLQSISAHDALVLLKNSLSAPKLQHMLRSAPCDGHPLLESFDNILRSALCAICNISLTDDQWIQASLPVRAGGLGVRRVSSLASPAFLASAAGTRDLQDQILRADSNLPDDCFESYLSSRLDTYQLKDPVGADVSKQRSWDEPVIQAELASLMNKYSDPLHRARLLAANSEHSGDWLHALPIAACGLRLDDNAIRVAVGLRLGSSLCEAHTCPCGAIVDTLGRHALSCKRNIGRSQRHAFINDIVWHALNRAGIPAKKEPHGLTRDDGKRPDGLTLIPWKSGRSATWDVTVIDTLAASYLTQSASLATSAAETAANRKCAKYTAVSQTHLFYPIAIETLGPICYDGRSFLREVGTRITSQTNDTRETAFLFQRISVAVQRFNAVCIAIELRTVSPSCRPNFPIALRNHSRRIYTRL